MADMLDHRDHLVGHAPAEYRRMVAIPADKAFQVDFAPVPELVGIQHQPAIAGPDRRLIQHHDTHLVRDIEIEPRIDLCMRAYGVAVGILEHLEPTPGIAPRHLGNAQEMPGVAPKFQWLAVEQLPVPVKGQLTPAEPFIAPIHAQSILRRFQNQPVEIRGLRRPELQPIPHLLPEGHRDLLASRHLHVHLGNLQDSRIECPLRHRRVQHIIHGQCAPGLDLATHTYSSGRGTIVAHRHVEFQAILVDKWFHEHIRNPYRRHSQERHILPDSCDVRAPE